MYPICINTFPIGYSLFPIGGPASLHILVLVVLEGVPEAGGVMVKPKVEVVVAAHLGQQVER